MFKLFKKRSRAEQNEKRYKKWLAAYVPSTTNTKIELEVCFTDQRGNNFYRLKNPAHLTRERAQAIEESLKAIEYGISKTELEERLKSVLDKINEISWNSAKKEELKRLQESARTEIGEFLYRMQTVTIDDLIIQSGLYFLYVDDENPYHISPETQQRKWELVKSDDELRAFFDVYGAGIARFEQYKRRNFPTLKPKAGTIKPEKKLNYINAIQQIRERYRENDYILTKGDTVAMQNVKYWLLCDYYAALERIIKEQERFEAEQSKNKK